MNKAASLVRILLMACSVTVGAAASCSVLARTESGLVCGQRLTANGKEFASFKAVPYAKQPLGELRFKELQPLEPWDDVLDASKEGPICPQNNLYCYFSNILYQNEACIHANIYVPIEALPDANEISDNKKAGLPILVFIHGGGFVCGSGDPDNYGPENLIGKGVIVITFNYRLGFFGFFSLGSQSIPGNNGLRDQLTLLRWVQRNARFFGGNPDDVTIMGQSAGSASVHLLTLSPASKGLFSRAILMSGVGMRGFFSSSPTYAKDIANQFLFNMGINSTDPEEIHRQLIVAPLEKIMKVNSLLEKKYVISVFVPVVESSHPGVTTVLDDDPEVLVAQGRGKDIPLIIGFTTSECEFFRISRLEQVNILNQIEENPISVLTENALYDLRNKSEIAEKIEHRYLNGNLTMDKYVQFCTDVNFKYPALKLAELRSKTGAPVFLYQFGYHSIANFLKYKGAAHLEDVIYVFRSNALYPIFGQINQLYLPDNLMRNRMAEIVANFAKCSNPTCNATNVCAWPQEGDVLKYQSIADPTTCSYESATDEQHDMINFFDNIYSNYKQ